jgi:hypothetical protein
MNPPCALPESVGKCSATIYQVAGDQLEAAGFVPPTTTCRNGAVVGVGGVALGTPAVP